jgi:hypothetical protein
VNGRRLKTFTLSHFQTKSEAASLPVYWSGPLRELTFCTLRSS